MPESKMNKISEAPLFTEYETRNRLLLVPFGVMLLVLMAGIAITLLDPGTYTPPAFERKAVLEGEWTAEYQAGYEEELPVRSFSRTVWGIIRYVLFHEGEQGVLIGTGGWLYTTEEFAFHENGTFRLEKAADYAASVQRFLEEKGIDLVVIIVPAKARVHPEHLGRYEYPLYHRDRYLQFRSALLDRGISAPDILAALGKASGGDPAFLRTDTHWSPAGAQAAADKTAEAVIPILESRGVRRGDYIRNSAGKVTYEGDLMNFLPLGPLKKTAGPGPDSVVTLETVHLSQPAQSLFGEIQTPAAVVGTSYSAGDLWDFQGALEASLDIDVLNYSEEGRGPFTPMRDFLEDISERNDINLRVVLWEIPERYVTAFERNSEH